MIPVEDAAGGAAAVLQDQLPERAPKQHADQVAHIENNADPKQQVVGKDLQMAQKAQNRCKRRPHNKNCRSAEVHLLHSAPHLRDRRFSSRTKVAAKKLLRAQGYQRFLQGDQLHQHIAYPNQPQNMQQGRTLQELPLLDHLKLPRTGRQKDGHQHQHRTSKHEPPHIHSTQCGQRDPLHIIVNCHIHHFKVFLPDVKCRTNSPVGKPFPLRRRRSFFKIIGEHDHKRLSLFVHILLHCCNLKKTLELNLW